MFRKFFTSLPDRPEGSPEAEGEIQLGNSTQNLINAASKLAVLMQSHAAPAWHAAMTAARVASLQYIVGGAAALALAGVAAWGAKRCFRTCREEGGDEGWLFGGLVAGAAAAILVVVAGTLLFNPWTWTGVFDPQVYIAGQVLGLSN